MPEITQRVYSRMVTEVEVVDADNGSFDYAYITTEPLMIPAGVKITFIDRVDTPEGGRKARMVFEQDMEIPQEPEGEPDE
jgi:hypothetical protein